MEAEARNPVCGDVLVLTARLQGIRLESIRFQASGCSAALAAGSVLTLLLQGLTAGEIREQIHPQRIEDALGGLPRHRRHAALLARDAAFQLAGQMPGIPPG